MKHALLLTIAATLLGLMLAGCTDDISLNLSGQSQFDEGELVEVPLAVNVTTFSVSNTRGIEECGEQSEGEQSEGTRAGEAGEEDPSDEPEAITDFEKQVDNIWVFQYDTDGNLLVKPRYYTKEDYENEGTWTVRLRASVASKIYVVANVGSETWASSYEDFLTEKQLLEQTLPSPYPVIPGTTENGAIPMEGVNDGENNEGVTVQTDQTEPIVVPVTRMYAKIKVKVNIASKLLEDNNAYVYSVTLNNIPWYCRVGTLYDAANMSQPATYPETTYWITRAILEKNDEDEGDQEEGYDYVFYIPENIQGVVDNTESGTKTDAAPTYATLLTAGIHYNEDETGAESVTDYTVCPGGNSVDNYNIRRNRVYRVTLNIGYPIETTYQPSANCIYAAPGTTVYFEPYYRTETGGGYKFEDYLDYTGEKGKQIKGVKILWQTLDCIGDNTGGDLVYFVPSSGSLDEQDLHDRIYVTVKEPGNAVIAAYADDKCEGDIIWSWHIWVPDADEPDPTNEANGKLFTTYYWDNDSIYGYKDANGNVTTNGRTPGYTIMDLNLGALRSYPTSSDAVDYTRCYGTMYQWGRKDPFPGAKQAAIDSLYTSNDSGGEYDKTTIEPLYANDGGTEVLMTEKDTEENSEYEDYLFHSVSGNTIRNDNLGVAYTIAHPTVFMCGTARYTSGISNTYIFGGDWMPEGQSDDKLWGATPVDETTKTYYVGQDNKGNDRHLYDDYGEEKSIFDPCPYGWRISPPDLWLSFTDTGLNPAGSSNINYSTTFGAGMNLYLTGWRTGATSYFPTQGPRYGNGKVTHTRVCGNYHNATSDSGNRVNILHVHTGGSFRIFEMTYEYYYVKCVAGPVRCVRETR